MPVETAADRAAMFSADDFGTAALYTPPGGGSAVPCTIVLDLGRPRDFEAEGGRGGARAAIARQRCQVLVDQVPVVAIGGSFEAGARTFRVAADPDLDETGAIWTVDLQEQ